MADRASIPPRGWDHEALLRRMEESRKDDADWRGGRTWSLVYYVDEAHHDFLKKAHNLFFAENMLNPMAFKSLKRMEAEVVQMTAGLLQGPPEAVGTVTTGGTESILLAVKSYRDRARRRRPWIRRPNMVVPDSIHVAFDKASHYFGVRMKRVPVGPDFRADVRAMRRAVDHNTVALAASAPQYPQGVVDPVEELGALALDKGLPLHVDACFGGFMLPWLERLGHPVPPWDFRVPGVTSISADVHKYGYAPKGISTVVYRSMDYLRYQFFIATRWTGGIYASPSLPGSRPGGPIAAGWAAMMALGEDGYLSLARGALDATNRLREGIAAIPELRLLGAPHCTVVTYAAADGLPEGRRVDLYAVADQMQERGWNMDRQQFPPSIHLTVNANNGPIVDQYLADLRDAVAFVRAHPELKRSGEAAMYGMMARLPSRKLVDQGVLEIMEQMYGVECEAPDLAAGGADRGRLGKLMDRYGDRVMDTLERLDRLRRR